MNGSFDKRALQEISGACTKLSQEASDQLDSGNRGQPHISSHFQCEQQKPWRWPAYSSTCVCVFANTINDGAKPKAHYGTPRRCSIWGVYMLEKYKNLGVKEGGGHLLEGGVFLGTYSTLCLKICSSSPVTP